MAAPWPLMRAILSEPSRRFNRRKTAGYAAYVVLYVLVVVAVGLLAWQLLAVIAIAAAVGTAAQMWLGRSSSGRKQGLPPGRLQLLPVLPLEDRTFLERALEGHPVTKAVLPTTARPVICIAGLQRGAKVLREQAANLEWVGMSFDELIPAGFLRTMAPDDHARYKSLFRNAFTNRVVAACVPRFTEYARAEIADLVSEVHRDPSHRTDPRPAGARFTISSNARLFLGISPEMDEFAVVERLYLAPGPLYQFPPLSGPRGEELRTAAHTMVSIVQRRVAELEATGDSTCFLEEIVRNEPDALRDPNVLLNLVFLLATASYDVTGLLHWIVKMLTDNPAWIKRVRADDGDLDKRLVQETLRLAQSEYIVRRATAPFEVEGYAVPEHWYLRVCVQESHRDPNVFESPETFDPDRFAGRRYTAAAYAPFGMLEHSCLGVPTTYALATAFVRAYCAHDWVGAADGAQEFDGFHWTPSHRLRIGLDAPRV